MTELENLGHRRRATDISNGLPGQGRPAELPGGGMPRPSSDKYSDAGTLPAPTCTGHRGHSVGGKPPLPTLYPIRHDGPPVGTERQAPCHSLVFQGGGVEEAAASRGGSEGELGEVLQGIREPLDTVTAF